MDGDISYANATYSVGRAFAGQMVQVTCPNGIVQVRQHGQLLRAWPADSPGQQHPLAQQVEAGAPELLALQEL